LYNVHDCYEELQAYLAEHKRETLEMIILHNEDPPEEEEGIGEGLAAEV